MKIGILTFHRPANFGANLQAYSSMCYLSSLGHEVKVIDYVRQTDFDYKNKVDIRQYEAHKHFVEVRLSLTKQITTDEDLCRIVKEEAFDAIVIGQMLYGVLLKTIMSTLQSGCLRIRI